MNGNLSLHYELDEIDKKLIDFIQNSFPLKRNPYHELGKNLNLTEIETIDRIKNLFENKFLKFIGAIIDTKSIGFNSLLTAFKVKEENLEHAVKIINSHPGVSHNYLRNAHYNLWFTLASPENMNISEIIKKLANLTKAESFIELPSLKTYKVSFILKADKKENLESERSVYVLKKENHYKINDFEKKLLNIIQYSLPLTALPFDVISEKLNISPVTVIDSIKNLKNKGIIKRIGGIVNHYKIGYTHNTLVLWEAPIDKLDFIGEYISSFKNVSHCYSRKTYPDWKYTLYTMIHSDNKENMENSIKNILNVIGKINFIMLDSVKEYKKERLVYFSDEYHNIDDYSNLTAMQ